MPPRKKTGRAAAEAAYANLLKENTALVGDVGEAFDAFDGQAGGGRRRAGPLRGGSGRRGQGWCRHQRSTRSDGLQEDLQVARTAGQAGEQHRREPAACLLVWPADQRRRAGAATGVSRRRNRGGKLT